MRSFWRFVLWTSLVAAAIIGVLRAVAIRWWRIPMNDPWLEASVEPTLRGGDLVLLWRLTPPRYGDLVVCPEPNAPERVVVGRILAEAGDRIEVKGGGVSVNEHLIGTERACSEATLSVKHPRDGQPVEEHCSMEVVAGALHPVGWAVNPAVPPSYVSTQVPAGRVFLVSDNRMFPLDSRDYGPVERSTCRESIFYRLVGLDGFFDVGRRFTYIP